LRIGYFYQQEGLDLFAPPPERLEFPSSNNMKRCPALNDAIKNTFVIKSPYDVHLKFEKYDEYGQAIMGLQPDTTLMDFESFIHVLPPEAFSDKKRPLMQLRLCIVFVTDEKGLTVEGFPPFLEYKPDSPIRVSVFKFNIYNWIRPCDCGIEWMDTSKDIVIKRGEPLLYVRFNTDKNVKLEKIERTPKLIELVNRNDNVKSLVKNMSYHVMLVAGRTRPKRLLP